MADKIEQQNITLEDPEQVVKEKKTSFLKQLDNTVRQTSKNVKEQTKKQVNDLKNEATEVYDKAQDFAEKHGKKIELIITRIAYATITLIIYFIHASALSYLSMSVNVNKGLGGVNMNGPPFKPPRFSINKCPDEKFSKGFFEKIRNSLKVFGFPYKNLISCDNFVMLKEPFLHVRFSRWISNTLAFSYSSGRTYLNAIFSFFSDPIAAFWIFPIFVPIILLLTLMFAPMITLFGGLLLSSEILPSGVFSMFTFEPLSMFFTAMAFGAGIFSLPLLNTFAMFASAVFFFTIFPYILNDKFIFPNDKGMKPYSGFDFIRKNISYRWETILLAWLIVVANITKQTFDTKEDLKAKVIETDGLKAKVRFNSGSELLVETNELSIDPDSYLTLNSAVDINTNKLKSILPTSIGGEKLLGVIRKIDTINGELIYTVVVYQIFNDNKGNIRPIYKETLRIPKSQITPIINEHTEKKIRKDARVIVNSKSTAGSVASMFIYLIALAWLIWIIFRHKSIYVVLSIVLFVFEFIIDNQVNISLSILLGVGIYYGIMYKDDVVDVAGEILDEATKIKEDKPAKKQKTVE